MIMKCVYFTFIILLIGLNNASADEDITEAISETTEAVTLEVSFKTAPTPKKNTNTLPDNGNKL